MSAFSINPKSLNLVFKLQRKQWPLIYKKAYLKPTFNFDHARITDEILNNGREWIVVPGIVEQYFPQNEDFQ